jgi:hypothetical protein
MKMRLIVPLVVLTVFTRIAKAADGNSVDSVIRAVYETISGPTGNGIGRAFKLGSRREPD